MRMKAAYCALIALVMLALASGCRKDEEASISTKYARAIREEAMANLSLDKFFAQSSCAAADTRLILSTIPHRLKTELDSDRMKTSMVVLFPLLEQYAMSEVEPHCRDYKHSSKHYADGLSKFFSSVPAQVCRFSVSADIGKRQVDIDLEWHGYGRVFEKGAVMHFSDYAPDDVKLWCMRALQAAASDLRARQMLADAE